MVLVVFRNFIIIEIFFLFEMLVVLFVIIEKYLLFFIFCDRLFKM